MPWDRPNLRLTMAALAATLLGACPGTRDTGEPADTGSDSGTDTGTDTDATATVRISYSFDGYYFPVSNCADAGLSELWVILDDGSGASLTSTHACDDSPISISGLAVGGWSLVVQSVEDPDTLARPYTGSSLVFLILDGGEADVDVVLYCEENGWDDGCGGG